MHNSHLLASQTANPLELFLARNIHEIELALLILAMAGHLLFYRKEMFGELRRIIKKAPFFLRELF